MSRVRPLREGDLDAWLHLRTVGFGARPEPRETQLATLRSRLPWSFGVDAGGRLAAVATWYPYRVWIGGVLVGTGALSGVASAPEARRRGHVRALLIDGLERLHERGVGLSIEHPFDPRFYAAFGFRSVPAGVRLEAPIERVVGDAKRATFRSAEVGATPELVERRRAFARLHTFAPEREPLPAPGGEGSHPWRRIAETAPPWDPPVAYLTEGGWAVVTTGEVGGADVLWVKDAGWADAAARTRVLDLLGAWRGQVERVRLDLPEGDPLARDEGPRYGAARPVLQARIVDVPAALGPLRAPIDAPPRVVRVHDGTCAWNDGRWRIAVGPEGTRVERTRDAVEADVTAAGLASLLAGASPGLLGLHGEAEGDLRGLRELARTTADHPPFLGAGDFF